MVKYTEKQIKEAVDIAIGDDGFRGICNEIENIGETLQYDIHKLEKEL